MKLLLLILLFIPVQHLEPKWSNVVIERSVARTVWEKPQKLQTETINALKDALESRRSPAEAQKFLATRCRDFGDGPSFECTQQMVVLEIEETVALEWLESLRSTTPKPLTRNAIAGIKFAFCRAGFGRQADCFLG